MGLFWSKSKDTSTGEEEQEDDVEEKGVETYSMDIDCENCGCSYSEDIPKGITIGEFLKNRKCEECGCLIKEED